MKKMILTMVFAFVALAFSQPESAFPADCGNYFVAPEETRECFVYVGTMEELVGYFTSVYQGLEVSEYETYPYEGSPDVYFYTGEFQYSLYHRENGQILITYVPY